MKVYVLLLVMNCIFVSLFSQDYELKGDWVGYLTQENMISPLTFYEFGLKVENVGKGNYKGKSYIATEGDDWSAMGEMEFQAQWSNNVWIYKETKIIQQRKDQNIQDIFDWCLKNCNFQLQLKQDSLILEGQWNGKANHRDCNPGYIRISKYYKVQNTKNYQLKNIKVEEKPLLTDQVKLGDKFQFSAIQFEPSKSYLLSSSYSTLDGLSDWLKKHPKRVVEVAGHTDKGRNHEYNMQLSEERAQTVVNYLIQRGVNPNQLKAKGYGSTQPIADNETVEGRKLNRRVEFIILQ